MSVPVVFAVAGGGALGASLRYMLAQAVVRIWSHDFPLATFIINVVGCFVMGVVMALLQDMPTVSPAWRAFLTVGILGGFTTFSAFSFETVSLFERGQVTVVLAYVVLSVLVCALAVLAGAFCVRLASQG